MEGTGRTVVYLSLQEILDINRRVILETGGFTAGAGIAINPSALAYLVQAPQAHMYGEELYPALADKAALYAFSINAGHVFIDGNKRTATISMLYFLRRNGCAICEALDDQEIIRVALNVASGAMNLEALTRWVQGIIR